jgi:hypothetical protein
MQQEMAGGCSQCLPVEHLGDGSYAHIGCQNSLVINPSHAMYVLFPYCMLSSNGLVGRALDFKDAIAVYVTNDCANDGDLSGSIMTNNDWESLRLVTKWLAVFCQATHQMSTTKIPMLSQTHAMFRMLQSKIKDILAGLPNDIDDNLREGLINAHRKLSDYFYLFDQSEYCMWASHVFLFCTFV